MPSGGSGAGGVILVIIILLIIAAIGFFVYKTRFSNQTDEENSEENSEGEELDGTLLSGQGNTESWMPRKNLSVKKEKAITGRDEDIDGDGIN